MVVASDVGPADDGTLSFHWSQWIILAGMAVGVVVVIVFEFCTEGLLARHRRMKFRSLTRHEDKVPLHPNIEQKLSGWVDGPRNVANFWSGKFLIETHSKDHYTKTYEILAVVCALMLSVTVSFYTSGETKAHIHGIVCCLGNCTLWMCTLMSAFFLVAFEACKTDAHVDLLVGLYGKRLLRAPFVLFTVGSVMVFLEFILYFKFTIDAGLNCSLCLGFCGLFLPMFGHAMHKMGWAITLVNREAALGNADVVTPTLEDLKESFRSYRASKDDNLLALDRDEFLLKSQRGWTAVTSVQRAILEKIFDSYVEAKLAQLEDFDFAAPTMLEQSGGAAKSMLDLQSQQEDPRPVKANAHLWSV